MNLAELQPANSLAALVQQLQQTIARINTVFGREHQADGQHKTPAWVSQTLSASDFTGAGSQTWVVAPSDADVPYWKNGTSMTVGFEIDTSTVGGTPNSHIKIKIPGGFTAKRRLHNMIYLTDNNVRVDGFAAVLANSTTIDIYRADVANYTGGTTAVRGQLTFETTA